MHDLCIVLSASLLPYLNFEGFSLKYHHERCDLRHERGEIWAG